MHGWFLFFNDLLMLWVYALSNQLFVLTNLYACVTQRNCWVSANPKPMLAAVYPVSILKANHSFRSYSYP